MQAHDAKDVHGAHDAHDHHHHRHASNPVHTHGHHLLQVEDLSVGFRMYDPAEPFFAAKQELVNVIDHLSIAVHEREIVALVGPSGAGKSLLADAIMACYEPNVQVEGRIWFDGELQDAKSLAALAGGAIAMVPQSVASLNPLVKVGRQVQGGLSHSTYRTRDTHGARQPGKRKKHEKQGKREEHARLAQRQQELFARYGLAPSVADLYPHELSGGMARRVLLCCALIGNPRLIVADEPTPGLDEAAALRVLEDFRAFADGGGGVLLITHDIELALRVADRIAVFHDKTIVEETSVASFASPEHLQHPFSRALWHALPEHGFSAAGE